MNLCRPALRGPEFYMACQNAGQEEMMYNMVIRNLGITRIYII